MNPRDAIRDFMTRLLGQRGDNTAFSDNDLLFSNGRLDSLAAIEMVTFLERQFGVDFIAAGFDMGQIDSVASVLALVAGQRSQPVREYS
jgi:acyl carrier protein